MSTASVSSRPGAVLADLLPASRVRDVALVAGGAALMGVAAQIAVKVPGLIVPITGQTFAALLIGAALGPARSFLSMTLYTLVGMAGVPWFAHGSSGAGGATFGYVLGMLLASTVVGALARRGADRSVPRTAATMVLGSALVYAVGVPYLALATGMSFGAAVAGGMTPFLIGDAVKAALAMGLLPATWKLLDRG
ncbi:biotin transporter BioY [Streptomyces sp. NPDC058279]|uniref:biotin transporter BioY n=1 Tax=Streptomyces sp. NPDC058279 TaxID=3346418 RepID=UPI0036E635E4